MEIRDWLLDLWKMGLLCDEYKNLVCNAASKRQIMDIVLDANGISFLQEMQSEGHALPYEYILEKFGPYLNGRYIYDANGRYTGDRAHWIWISCYITIRLLIPSASIFRILRCISGILC